MNLAVQLYRQCKKVQADMTFDTESTLFLLTVTPIIDTRSASVIIPAALMVD